MACTKKQKGMVFHQEGATTSAAAPAAEPPAACSLLPKPEKARDGRCDRLCHITGKETGMMGETATTSAALPAVKHPTSPDGHPDTLSPVLVCRGIRVALDNNSTWNEFFRCRTEMIVTKQGSRMFPYCRFHISGLQPSKKYSLIMDIQPLDNSCYKWTGRTWQVAGKAESHVKGQPFAHPESPSMGQHWMQNPVSFYKLKLTNDVSNQEGNITLHPLHRYLPRLYIVQTDKAAKDIKLTGPSVVTFTFPQTEFMAVTSYQNSRFSQLKVDCNPFAKGLKEDGSSSWGRKLNLNSGKESQKDKVKETNEGHPLKKSLKSLLANHKPRISKPAGAKSSEPGDTGNKDQFTANAPTENIRSQSPPAQKLFSELIREAHISLQRCNIERRSTGSSTSQSSELVQKDVPDKQEPHCRTPSEKNSDSVSKQRRVKSNRNHLNVETSKKNTSNDNCEVNNEVTASFVSKKKSSEEENPQPLVLSQKSAGQDCRTAVVSRNASVDSDDQLLGVNQKTSLSSDNQPKSEAISEVNTKQQKRRAPLPLPALALFLKQHSTKSKKAKSKPDSPPRAPPSQSRPSSSDATDPINNLTDDVKHCNSQFTFVHTPEPVVEDALHHSSSSGLDAVEPIGPTVPRTANPCASITVAHSPESCPAEPDCTPVLCTPETSTLIITSPLATYTASPSPLDTVLNVPTSPEASHNDQSATLPPDTLTLKCDSLLPDPECSSFGFEPLSPASSPEPLPTLPASLAFEFDSTPSEPSEKSGLEGPEVLAQREESTTSVFKWHTVLPPCEPSYMETSFSTFEPTSQIPCVPVPSPPLPSPPPVHQETQNLEPSTSMTLTDPASSFQDNEQSLPFPAELSTLVLQLPLSPTFSSLDGDALSPTPSLTDLVQFFSTNDDLGMEVAFSNTEATPVPITGPTTVTQEANAQEPLQEVETVPAKKPFKSRKKSGRQKHTKVPGDKKVDDSVYASMRPNLEEVEEQLFISFTSKEALELHIPDLSEEAVPVRHPALEINLPPPTDTPDESNSTNQVQHVSSADNNVPEHLHDKIRSCEKILLRDLKMMKHRQVIHPVLQEVGLKLNLLDPTLTIDLQYLGVRLPIPPPGVALEPLTQELPASQGVSAAFVSRTGKTTDVTQIKGWRDKFSPAEAPPTPPAKPEAGPSSDPPKKNLSAFCSDMLDEYLENEGKLIDERAASFSQSKAEEVVYKLPARSTSYVRTLDSVLKKHSSPTSEIISGFIPPSKRPKLSLQGITTARKLKGQKKTVESTLQPCPAEPNLGPKCLAGPQSEQAAPHKSHEDPLNVGFKHTEPSSESLEPHSFKRRRRRRRLEINSASPKLGRPRRSACSPNASGGMAPVESDSELGPCSDQGNVQGSGPVMTRALLRQKDLEDGVVWEGHPRTTVTKERATIALTSLFTLTGFASENPTAPIQLVRRRAPPCLNDFCRLGCICTSLAHTAKVSHCGLAQCMFGCSCLKQKVVLLKNLDSLNPSTTDLGATKKKRRRKRRMKMAYVLKEAETVSQPAERVKILWKRDGADPDPEATYIPELVSLTCPSDNKSLKSSCARVRGYSGKRSSSDPKLQDQIKGVKPESLRQKSHQHQLKATKDVKKRPPSPPPAAEPGESAPSPPADRAEPTPKPSKRLIILTESKWANETDRDLVLKTLCEAMAKDQLDHKFWIRGYLIRPLCQTVEGTDTDHCVQYKVHISRPTAEKESAEPPQKLQQQEDQTVLLPHMQSSQRECQEPQEHAVMEEEEEPPEEWQQEVEEDNTDEEEEPTPQKVESGTSGQQVKTNTEKTKVCLALPFLTGISPAGFLSAKRKQPGGTDHLVEVNGKPYPLAKIQLGKMGALHPANRLAAYLTGRVGSIRKPLGSAQPAETQISSGPSSQTTITTVTPSQPQPTVTAPKSLPLATTVKHQAIVSTKPAMGAPASSKTQMMAVRVYPVPPTGSSPVIVTSPASSQSSAPKAVSQVSRSVLQPVTPVPGQKKVQVLQAPAGSRPMAAVIGRAPGPTAILPSGQKVVLQQVPSSSGQYFRLADGKLVQLLPVSKVKGQNPSHFLKKGAIPTSTRPRAPLQTQGVSVVKLAPSQTTEEAKRPSTETSSLSGFQSFSVSPVSAPLAPGSGFLAQKGTCTFKIVPAASNKEPMLVTCPKLPSIPQRVSPPPRAFTHLTLKPPAARKAESDGSTVTPTLQRPASSQSATLIAKTQISLPLPASASEVTLGAPSAPGSMATTKPEPLPVSVSETTPACPSPPVPCSEVTSPEMARDPLDLDIVCVSDDGEIVVDTESSSSGETDNSSDFEGKSDSDTETSKSKMDKLNGKLKHNYLERWRRNNIAQKMSRLRTEVGLEDKKTSKITTLLKAVDVIQMLHTTETDLVKKKEELMSRRDGYLSTLIPSGESETPLTECRGIKSLERRPAVNQPPAQDPNDDNDDVIIMSSNQPPAQDHNDDDVIIMSPSQQPAQDHNDEDVIIMSSNQPPAQDPTDDVIIISSIKTLKTPSTTFSAHPTSASVQSSVSLTTPVTVHTNVQNSVPVTTSPPVQASAPVLTPVHVQTATAVPTSPPAQTSAPVPIPVHDQTSVAATSPHHVQTSVAATPPPILAPVSVATRLLLQMASQVNPPAVQQKPRTVPNILSRRKKTSEAPSITTVVPTEVLSLLGPAVPGQQVLTLGSVEAGMAILQAVSTSGVASVTLNVPSLTNQPVHLNSVPYPPTAPNLLHMVPEPQQVSAAQTLLVSTGPDPTSDQDQAQDQNLKQTQDQDQSLNQDTNQIPMQVQVEDHYQNYSQDQENDQNLKLAQDLHQEKDQDQANPSSRSSASCGAGPSSLGSGMKPDDGSEVPDSESLTSLLNEIVFLNQSTVSPATVVGSTNSAECVVGGADEVDHTNMETGVEELQGQAEKTPHKPPNGNTKAGVLTPPPLLQMKVGGVKASEPAPSDGAAGGGPSEGAVAWRPMPRLVPLGLRGTPPS